MISRRRGHLHRAMFREMRRPRRKKGASPGRSRGTRAKAVKSSKRQTLGPTGPVRRTVLLDQYSACPFTRFGCNKIYDRPSGRTVYMCKND